MIEEVILNYLRENAFSCYMSMPEKPSGNFCILEKTGDSPDEGIYTAMLAVQSYLRQQRFFCRSAEPFCGAGYAGRRHSAGNRLLRPCH